MRSFLVILFVLLILFIPVFQSYSEDAVSLYKQGKEHFFYEDYESAIYYLKRSIEINPNYIDPLIELAKLYYELKQYDYSYNYIQQSLNLEPKNKKLYLFSADIESKLGRYDIAEKKYKNIIQDDPINIVAYNGLANLYLLTNKTFLAKENLDRVLKSDPNNFLAINMTAKYYENIEKSYAEKYYIMNIENNSLNPDSYFYFSIYKFNNNNIQEAVDNIKTAISLSEKLIYKKYYGKYLLFLNKGDKALEIFREIVKKESNNHINYYYLANAYYLISNYNKTVESLLKALDIREDDEISSYFLNYVLVNKFNVDDKLRKERSFLFYKTAIKMKKESLYDLYIFNLKESIRLYPKISEARVELAEYFLTLKLPERYLRELSVASKYSEDINLKDRLEIEKKRISYKLGDDWNIDQYLIEHDNFIIPLFTQKEINNDHYNSEKISSRVLRNSGFEYLNYETRLYTDKEYSIPQMMKISKENKSPFYVVLKINEKTNDVEMILKLFNSINNELIKEYKVNKSGNDRIIRASIKLNENLNKDIPFKAHILKTLDNKAIINSGRYSGLKLKDKIVILNKNEYLIEFSRGSYIYSSDDVKAVGIITKLDEKISEIKFKSKNIFRDIDIDDIVIFKN